MNQRKHYIVREFAAGLPPHPADTTQHVDSPTKLRYVLEDFLQHYGNIQRVTSFEDILKLEPGQKAVCFRWGPLWTIEVECVAAVKRN